MRKLKWILITYALFDFLIGGYCGGFLPLSPAAAAQFTTVTGTVVDPNSIPYAFGTISATLVLPGGTSPTLGGLPYTPPTQPTGLDKNGSFTLQLADNTQLQPGGTQWNFTVCSAIGTVQPAGGKGPVCFTLAVPITISGSSQSISSNLNAVAPSLATFGGGGGGGAGSPGVFVASTACGGVANCVQLIDDDVTDNCLGATGTALTNWLAAINSYSGPGLVQIYFVGSGIGKAFLFNTCQLAFLVNHEITNQATLDFGTTQTPAHCLQHGPATLTSGYNTGGTSITWRFHGGFLTGCTGATTAGLESEPWMGAGYLYDVHIYNFGPGASTAGQCSKSAVKFDIATELHLSNIAYSDGRANTCFSVNSQDCGSSSSCTGPTAGQNTLHFSDSTIVHNNGGSCGSIGHIEAGTHTTITNVSFWGWDIPLLLTGGINAGGWNVVGNTIDSAGCSVNGVSAAVQFGHTGGTPGGGLVNGPTNIIGNDIPGGSGHSSNAIAIAGNSTDTIVSLTASNNDAITNAIPLLLPGTACTTVAGQNTCFIGPNSGLTSSAGTGWTTFGPLSGSDSFTRANANPLGGNWVANPRSTNQLKIVSNTAQLAASGTTSGSESFTSAVFNNDQTAAVTISTIDANANTVVVVETNSSLTANTYYAYSCGDILAVGSSIAKSVAGVTTVLVSQTSAIGCAPGDTIELRRIQQGANVMLAGYRNGVLDKNLSPNPVIDTSSTISGGYPGLAIAEDASGVVSLTNFVASSPTLIDGTTSQWAADTYAKTYNTLTNCNPGSSVSPAACGSAPSGTVVVPTSTTTYTVNTTAVTNNSRITILPITDNSGLTGGPTCNAPPTPFVGYESGRTAGTSFTFTLPLTTGASCWTYQITN